MAQTQTKTAEKTAPQPERTAGAVAMFKPPRIPYHAAIEHRLGVDQSQWRVLIDSIWPGAKTVDAVCLAISYCKARSLDPFKRPVHIVPMWNSAIGEEVETVWPGISEVRTTAARTGEYGGADETVFGEERTHTFEGKDRKGNVRKVEVTFPTWARITVYRIIKGVRVPFPGPRVVFMETFSWWRGVPVPNERWARAPYQMLEKCAEAAALRKAFPEEMGADLTAEEMEGKPTDHHGAAQQWASEPAIDGTAEKAPPVSVAVDKARAEAPARELTPPQSPSSAQGATTAPAQDPRPAPAAAAKAAKAAPPVEDSAPPADENGDPLEIPAALDRRDAPQDAAPQQTAKAAEAPAAAPADDEPRKMPYQGPPGFWAAEFVKLIDRMPTPEDVAELERLNQKMVQFVNLQDKASAQKIDQAFIARRAALAA